MRLCPSLLITASLLVLLTGCRQSSPPTESDWTLYGRTTDEQRFSPLTQINDQNIAQLGLTWSRELGTTRGLEATPLESEGIIYTTGEWSVAFALDARSGRILWTFDPKVDRSIARTICCDVVNRGVALYRGKVYLGTVDGRLIALDAKSGKAVWDVVTADQSKPYAITGAPRMVKEMVLIGNAGSEFGVRGYLSAYNAETGKLLWRTYTVPGNPALGFESKALESAAKTWHGEWWKAGGGGTPWDTIVYDPVLDLVYTGTGNGTAWYRDQRSPGGGDNLYLASILALRPGTGEIVWHYQVTPGENWDYDATQPLMLAELNIGGTPRKVIMQASKNGFFYVLDRQSGQFLSAKQFVNRVTWATAIDPTSGRPVEAPTAYRGMEAVLVSPAPGGAHNWYPMAFSPATGLVYVPAREGSQALHAPDKHWTYDRASWNRGEDAAYNGPLVAEMQSRPPMTGHLVAWNPVEQREVWNVSLPLVESGGVLATAGNLVFQGRSDGMLCAYRSTDGKKLWQFDAGTGIMAPPITYLLDGVQYITLRAAARSRLATAGFSPSRSAAMPSSMFPPMGTLDHHRRRSSSTLRRKLFTRGKYSSIAIASTVMEWAPFRAPAFLTCAMPPLPHTSTSNPLCLVAHFARRACHPSRTRSSPARCGRSRFTYYPELPPSNGGRIGLGPGILGVRWAGGTPRIHIAHG
jgi:quinohemoprotein ethanol dehydrogenase